MTQQNNKNQEDNNMLDEKKILAMKMAAHAYEARPDLQSRYEDVGLYVAENYGQYLGHALVAIRHFTTTGSTTQRIADILEPVKDIDWIGKWRVHKVLELTTGSTVESKRFQKVKGTNTRQIDVCQASNPLGSFVLEDNPSDCPPSYSKNPLQPHKLAQSGQHLEAAAEVIYSDTGHNTISSHKLAEATLRAFLQSVMREPVGVASAIYADMFPDREGWDKEPDKWLKDRYVETAQAAIQYLLTLTEATDAK